MSKKSGKCAPRGGRPKGYADGGYVPVKGEKTPKTIGAPARPTKNGKMF